MPVPADPFSFANLELADATQVNARFAALYAALDGGLDESNAAVPKGVVAAYRATNVSAPDDAPIVLNGEEFDVSGWFSTATGLYTPQVAAYYRFTWQVALASGGLSTDPFQSVLLKNGVGIRNGSLAARVTGAGNTSSSGSALVQANGSTDTFGLTIFTGNSPVTVKGGAQNTYMHVELIGRA